MGVGTSLKHFAANNQEYRRMLIDAVVDERALREIYLAGFEKAVKVGKPWTVMAAYNRLNGTYCTENERLLNDILREEWGFDGIVISDWGAINARVAGLAAGLDLEMPGVPNGNRELIIEAVRNGKLSEQTLDEVVHRLLHFVDRCQSHLREEYACDLEAHHQLAIQAAAEGAVLLKNENHMLPLQVGMQIALIGQFAKTPRYQGSGSSLIHPWRLDTLFDAMSTHAGNGRVLYEDGYPLKSGQKEDALLQEAIALAGKADTVVICAGLTDMDEVESMDRTHLHLPPAQERLIAAVSATNPRTVVLLSNGSPVEMPWIEAVPAVLEGYLGGQAGASAHCRLLYGEANPSGKLAETFPLRLEDTPAFHYFPGGPKTVEYLESIFVGYRFYDSTDKPLLFPFGHGLSYTSFAYSGLEIGKVAKDTKEFLNIQFMLENTGKMMGKEIAQIYIHKKGSSVFRSEKELKGFVKVQLDPGEKKKVAVNLDRRAFCIFSSARKAWILEAGDYEILVGSSSRDIRLTAGIHLEGERLDAADDAHPFYMQFPAAGEVPPDAFSRLLGSPLPGNDPDPRPYTLNTPIVDMQASLIGRILQRVIRKQVQGLIDQDLHGPTKLMIEQMALESPLRVLMMFSGGTLTRNTLEGLLLIANRKMLKGIFHFLRPRRDT
jgi:beta-glucosidase